MRILIVEDELYTAEHLKQLLVKCDSTIEVAGILDSVKEVVKWMNNNVLPDLIFQDIVLKDGNCFEIYDKVDINVPVVFTTAYSEYALQSFRVNSIEYIVKPYDYDDICQVLKKYEQVKMFYRNPETDLMKEILSDIYVVPRKRFLVKTGDRYYTVRSDSIAYFFYDESVTTGITRENKSFIVDNSIQELANQLDKNLFFQINRKYIVHIDSITKIVQWFNNRLKIDLEPKPEEDIFVSRERVKLFKSWLNQ